MTNNNGRATLRAVAAIACAASGAGNLAWGQTNSADGASAAPAQALPVATAATGSVPAGTSGGTTQIEEVVVTATKRKQSVRDIPASISVFTGTQLENSGKTNLTDFIEESPGVTASEGGPGFTRVTMRGIDTDTSPYSGMTSTVGYFIGDTAFTDPYNNSIIPDLSAFDLQSVEVLKGPQGTLFGGAALSGAVRYELQDPLMGEWEGRAFTQFDAANGGGNALSSGAVVNVPLYKDELAGRVAYIRHNYPGTMLDGYNGQPHQGYGGGDQIRAIVAWQPLENLHIKLTHLTQDFDSSNALNYSSSPSQRVNVNTVLQSPSNYNFRLDNAEAGYSFSGMKLTALWSSLQKNSQQYGDDTPGLIGTPPQGYPASATLQTFDADYSKAFSEELRLQSTGEGPLKWITGLYVFNETNHFELLGATPLGESLLGPGSLFQTNPALLSLFGLLGIPPSYFADTTSLIQARSDTKTWEHAAYADVSYTLWHRLDLEAGARFYEASVGGGYLGNGLLVTLSNNLQPTDTEATLKQKGISPKASATFHFSKDISLYAMAAKGFRYGGINDFPSTPTNGVPATYKSDYLWNYEVGLRTNWLHNTLQADVTAYYIDYKNPIIGQTTKGPIGISYSDNVGAAVGKGIEPSLLWKTPLRGLTLSAAGSVSSAHSTVPFTDSTGTYIAPGQEMPGANHLQGNATASYLRPLAWGVRGGPNVGYTYVGKGYNDINHDLVINGFGTLSAGLVFEGSPFGYHSQLAINGTNLLDTTKPMAGVTGSSLLTQQSFASYALTPPRMISVRLSLDL